MAFAKLKALLRAKASGLSTPYGRPSGKYAICSAQKNAKTTSPPQDTDSLEAPML